MSPEQAQSFPDIDGRTDLFSVGAILYEMLTGEPPHSAPTYEAVLIAICTRDAADVRAKAPEVPEKLAHVIARALKRDRQERYGSAQEMLTDLEAALRHSRALATKTRASAGPWRGGSTKSRAESYRTWVLTLVAALGGFAVAAYLVARGTSPRPEPERDVIASPSTPLAAASSPDTPPLAPPASAPLPPANATEKAPPRLTQTKLRDALKPSSKKPAPAASAGVAGSLGLSTREP
jgi:serine/threonine protein kinase